MNKEMVLSSMDYAQLRTLDLGGRVRYIREFLQKEYGNKYSGKSLANRIGVSQSNYTYLENKANDIPSKILRAISKDFNVAMDVFFDDFYEGEPKTIIIKPLSFDEKIEPAVIANRYSDVGIATNKNPADEDSYTFVVVAYLEASNGDRRMIFNSHSKELYQRTHVQSVVASMIHAMDEIDRFINPGYRPSDKTPSPAYQALQHIELRDNPELYVWIPQKLYNDTLMTLEKAGREYTSKLLERAAVNKITKKEHD